MGYAERWWPARAIVKEALENPVSADGKIVKLGQFCPWKEHLYELEKELGKEDKALYMLFMDSRGGWRIQCVGVEGQAFANRKGLPAAWRGIRDEELSKVSGVEKCVFVHAAGFIGGNQTYEGALKMAQLAVEMEE